MKCMKCGKETDNPKFCSRSCSASINGVLFPKKTYSAKCKICGVKAMGPRRKFCEIHFKERQEGLENIRNLTIAQYVSRKSIKDKHPSWKFSHIRGLARSWFSDLARKPCAKCGYDKHVELAHIQPISSFSPETTLGVINCRDNIIQLCPNCHWEYDHPSSQ